ncbi:MAG: IS3 family transposase [Candidatus Odinarchaeia archaeon]
MTKSSTTEWKRKRCQERKRRKGAQIQQPGHQRQYRGFWHTVKEVLEKEWFESLEGAQAAIDRYVSYYNYHRLNKAISYNTFASRYYGVPFTD